MEQTARGQAGTQQHRGRALSGVLAVALLVRGTTLLVTHQSLEADPDAYRLIAENVRTHGTLGRPARGAPDELVPTAYRPPLYPLVLAAISGGDGPSPPRVATLHLVLGLATVGLVWRLADQFVSRRAAVVAATLVTLDPILLQQSSLVMTETLAALLATVVVFGLDRVLRVGSVRATVGAGAALGLAALCRPTFLPFVPVAALVIAWRFPGRARAFQLAAVLLLVTTIAVAPWVIRNRLVFGRWIATTTHGGYTLLLGNNPSFYRHLREAAGGAVWAPAFDDQLMEDCRRQLAPDSLPPPASVQAELREDALAYRCAKKTIEDDPATFVRACAYRIGQFWSPLPHARGTDESTLARAARYLVAGWYTVVLGLAAAGCLALGRTLMTSPWCWTLLLVATFVAAHTAYWSNLRMRGPMMPLIILWAVAGLEWLLIRVGRGAGDLR